MPVRNLNEFLEQRNLIQSAPLSNLSGYKVGIEGMNWVKKTAKPEVFHVAVGGAPLSLTAALRESALKFRAANISPVFVFNGLTVPRPDAVRSSEPDLRSQKRISGWEAYYKGEIEVAATHFQSSEKNIAMNYLHLVFDMLESQKFEFFRAPVLSWGQLMYFEKQRRVACVYGGSELLMAGCDRVILSIDWHSGVYRYVDRRRVLDDLGTQSHTHFLDMCVLAGFDYASTYAPLLEGRTFTFDAAVQLVKRHRAGVYAVQQRQTSSQHGATVDWLKKFLTARALVHHMVVLELTGFSSLLHRETVPQNMHEVVGPRFPDEVYYLISQCVINVQLFNNLVSGALVESPPLVDSHEYRTLLDEILSLRESTLAIVTGELSEYFASRRVTATRWYDSSVEVHVNHAAARDGVQGLHPRVHGDVLLTPNGPAVTLADVARRLVAPDATAPAAFVPPLLRAPQAPSPAPAASLLASAIAAPLVKLLVLRGFAVRGGAATNWGRALAKFSPAFGEAGMLALELLRLNKLNGSQLNHIPPEVSQSFDGEQQVLLLTRTFSILPCALLEEAWEGPLDHDLLGFNSLMKAIHRSLRNCLEADLLARVLRREHRTPLNQLRHVSRVLPFRQESNTALGIALKHLMLQPATARAEFASSFHNCANVHADLHRGAQFWNELLEAVRLLASLNEVKPETLALFESAKVYLDQFNL
mmetsp:Transcript_22919/g.38984  ORF Transcript_22919/g.38984 Transcript_22919/m.38984 type:complete len:702 (-) Transcript_22919:69-2174(-)